MTRVEEIAIKLHKYMVDNNILSTEKHPQWKLSRELGTNQTTISKALILLQEIGKVEKFDCGKKWMAYRVIDKKYLDGTIVEAKQICTIPSELQGIQTQIFEATKNTFAYMENIYQDNIQLKDQNKQLKETLDSRQQQYELLNRKYIKKLGCMQNFKLLTERYFKDINKIIKELNNNEVVV